MGNNPNELRQRLTLQIQKRNIERIANDTEEEHNMMKQSYSYQIAKKHFDEETKHVQSKIKLIQKRNQELRRAYDECKKEEGYLKNEYDQLIRQASQQYPRRSHFK